MHHTFNPVRSTSTSSNRMKTILGRLVETVIEKLRNPRIRSVFESLILGPSSEVDKRLIVCRMTTMHMSGKIVNVLLKLAQQQPSAIT